MFKLVLTLSLFFIGANLVYSGDNYRIISQNGFISNLNLYKDISIDWIDLGESNYTSLGYKPDNKDEWLSVIRKVNLAYLPTLIDSLYSSIPGKNISYPLKKSGEPLPNKGLWIQFSNVNVYITNSYQCALRLTILFKDGKTRKDISQFTIITKSTFNMASFEKKLIENINYLAEFIINTLSAEDTNTLIIKDMWRNELYTIYEQSTPVNNFTNYKDIYVSWLDLGEDKFLKYDFNEDEQNEWVRLINEENLKSIPKHFKYFLPKNKIFTSTNKNGTLPTNGLIILFKDADFKQNSYHSRVDLHSLYVTIIFIDGPTGKALYQCRVSVPAFANIIGSNFARHFSAQLEFSVLDTIEMIAKIYNGELSLKN